jgi:hypothetical protein
MYGSVHLLIGKCLSRYVQQKSQALEFLYEPNVKAYYDAALDSGVNAIHESFFVGCR